MRRLFRMLSQLANRLKGSAAFPASLQRSRELHPIDYQQDLNPTLK